MVAAVVVGTLVFFRVDTVAIGGNGRYTTQEILEASGIEANDNLFLMNKFAVQREMNEALPYVGDVTIHRALPSTIQITVEEREPVAAVRISNGYWYMDASGRLLEMQEENAGYIEVTGVSLVSPTGGGQLTVGDSDRLKGTGLVGLLTALEDADLLENAQSIDLSEGSSMMMDYTDRYQVKIPYGADYAYKVRALEGIVDALEADNDNRSGVIDLTLDNEWHFIPD
jgi:cell division protein FtsQ